MRKLFLDWETYYDDVYSLKKMTPVEYILSPQFEELGCAVAYDDEPARWVDGPDLPAFFKTVDWSAVDAISHNALFDMLILTFRHAIFPAHYGCSMSMMQNWMVHQTGSASLDAGAKRYGLAKGYLPTKGVNWHQLSRDAVMYKATREYAVNDVNICRFLYNTMLSEGFPVSELEVIDWVVRMAAIPQLEMDRELVAAHLGEVLAHKQKLLDDAELENRDPVMRDEMMALALMAFGVDPVPRKMSKKTGKEQWAFAKTDKEFTDLLEHPDDRVQAIVAARLGHKSTLEETRSQRFLAISALTKTIPVPLKYSGAHTHRLSGAWSLNLQNLPNKGPLRKALRAPKGCVVVSVDASQIEARLNAVLSGEYWLIEAFREGRDVYAEFASLIYNRTIIKQLDKVERFVGKTGILSLGYGSSAPVFQSMCRNKGDVILPYAMAEQVISIYRARCPAVVEHWKMANNQIIPMISSGSNYQWGALTVGREKLTLPNGNALRYMNLRHEYIGGTGNYGWTYQRGPRTMKIYGAKLVENECQSLAFLHIAEVAMRVKKMTDNLLIPVHQIHDELLYVVPEKIAEQAACLVAAEMAKPPAWLPDAPLAAEYGIGESYGDAK
jgi:DNA polymerase